MSIKCRSHCPITFALDLFGDKWSLLILRDLLLRNKCHYQEFLNSGEGISTNILADRLNQLEGHGLIKKEKDESNKKQYIYSPTIKAKDLTPMLAEIIAWSAKYDPQTGVPEKMKRLIKKDKGAFIESLKYENKTKSSTPA